MLLNPGWTPTSGGDYKFLAYTVCDQDGDATNDTLTIHVHVLDPTAVAQARAGRIRLLGPIVPNPSPDFVRMMLRLPAGEETGLTIFSSDGRKVISFRRPAGPGRDDVLVWDGRDAAGRTVPAGTYFVRARAGGLGETARLVRLAP